MKLKPQIYAQTLIASLKDQPDTKKVSKNLWYSLQKNKQYRDLPKILSSLDEEFAKENNLILAKIYSEKELDEKELSEIKAKVEKKIEKNILLKNIVKNNWAGITVEVDGKILDLSLKGKIEKLKQVIQK